MRRFLIGAIVAASLLLVIFIITDFDIKGHNEGLFLLKSRDGHLLEVSDDLYLGDADNLICGVDFQSPHFKFLYHEETYKRGEPYLEYNWADKDGSGYVRNFMPDGTELLTCFSRFIDDNGKKPSGLFVGGGLPDEVRENDLVKYNETGMSYFNGSRWIHIWCTTNECISSQGKNFYPSDWKFLGSRVLNRSYKSLVIESLHEANINGAQLRIDRHAYFRAGEPYFLLSFKITNVGNVPARFYYIYADEPWVGSYGTARGNVGWTKDGLIGYVRQVDAKKYNYFGMFDYGNDVIGERHNYTMAANFLQWIDGGTPEAYFSNSPFEHPEPGNFMEPLKSNERTINLQWGPEILYPGESKLYSLAIGMAGNDPRTGFPVKPKVNIPSDGVVPEKATLKAEN